MDAFSVSSHGPRDTDPVNGGSALVTQLPLKDPESSCNQLGRQDFNLRILGDTFSP